MDPFTDEPTMNITCDVVEPSDGKGYDRDPRSIAQARRSLFKVHGPGRNRLLGPEPRILHFFDSVTWKVDMSGSMAGEVNSEESPWTSREEIEGGNKRSPFRTIKGGYFHVPATVNSLQVFDSQPCVSALEEQGVEVEVHHREVDSAGSMRDWHQIREAGKARRTELQILKYTVHNVAHSYGKTATFMPKPVVGDNGSPACTFTSPGMERGENLFYRRQRLRGVVRVRFVLHSVGSSTREGAERHHQPWNEFLQAAGVPV